MTAVSILFARRDSVYKTLPDLDVWDEDRDARRYAGSAAVVAHPPCRAWGQLRGLANPRPGEKELALFAVAQVRRCGGVLEHPARSSLWPAAGLPEPGETDPYGGFTLVVSQRWWGHRAEKLTRLYVVGVSRSLVPRFPFALGDAPAVCGRSGRRSDGSRLRKGDLGWRPEISKAEREATPVAFARFLVDLAGRAGRRFSEVPVLVTPGLCTMGGTFCSFFSQYRASVDDA